MDTKLLPRNSNAFTRRRTRFTVAVAALAVFTAPEALRAGPAAGKTGGAAPAKPAASAGRIASCAPIPGVSYVATTGHGRPEGTRNGGQNPDVNIKLRGAKRIDAPGRLVEYPYPANEPPDPKAPKLYTLFGPDRVPAITALYKVGVFEGIERGTENRHPWPQLAGFQTQPGEIVECPASGYVWGKGGWSALVVYVDENSMALSWDGDSTISGYSLHILGIAPEPSLRALYEEVNASGRTRVPVVRSNQPLGRAMSTEIWVAMRDSGDFLDPRSRLDWWKGAPAADAPPATAPPQAPPAAARTAPRRPDAAAQTPAPKAAPKLAGATVGG